MGRGLRASWDFTPLVAPTCQCLPGILFPELEASACGSAAGEFSGILHSLVSTSTKRGRSGDIQGFSALAPLYFGPDNFFVG